MCFFFGDALRRDSASRNMNRGRKRKRWGRGRGEKAVRKRRFFSLPSPLALFPMSFSVSTSIQLLRSCNSYFPNHKRKKHTDKPSVTQATRCASERRRGRKQEKYRDCRASLENSIFTPSFSSPAIPDLHLCLAFASLADFCTLYRLERENRKAVNCQLLL